MKSKYIAHALAMRQHRRRQLAAAYRASLYRAGEWSIHIDQRHPALDAALADLGFRQWAFLTAVNPSSCRLTDADNHGRMQALLQALKRCRQPFILGESIALAPARHGDWPPEAGVLLPGLALGRARRLARRFGQNALVAGVRGRRARLVWLVL